MKSTALKLALLLFVTTMFGCKKDKTTTESLDDYSVDVTFNGETRKCKQFNSLSSDEGTLIGSCVFLGDVMSISFGGTNYLDPTKSNGFNGVFTVSGVTGTGTYSFHEADLDLNNETVLVQRVTTGPSSTAWDAWTNDENIHRYFSGFCREEDRAVAIQEIDVTRYSSEVGGVIEGTFYMTVYETPDGCSDDIPHVITGVFKCKRINLE